jgi:hypothetical protein
MQNTLLEMIMNIRFSLFAVLLATLGVVSAANADLPDPGLEVVGGRDVGKPLY